MLMEKLSQTALDKSANVIKAIKQHPFNKELAEGSLKLSKFSYYIEQDTIYLRDFARSLAMIAAKAPLKFVKNFLSFSEGALIAEQEAVHDFFRTLYDLQVTNNLTPATLSYTSYLLQVSSIAPVEIAIASVLPCFVVYNIVGRDIAKNTDFESKNPYLKWIETYSSQEFSDDVDLAIGIFDEVARTASNEIQLEMLEAFYKSAVLEWHFWNDAYNEVIYDAFDLAILTSQPK